MPTTKKHSTYMDAKCFINMAHFEQAHQPLFIVPLDIGTDASDNKDLD